MLTELKKIDKQKVGFFLFKRLNGRYLLSNDVGDYYFLEPKDFELFLSGRTEMLSSNIYEQLRNKGFVRDWLDFDDLAKRYAIKNEFLGRGPTLHIIVVTLRCDHKCSYCQSGSQELHKQRYDMNIETARRVVDIVFDCPENSITIEFQGGEPLLNFKVMEFIINYSLEKNKKARKRILFSLVSNLTFMTKNTLRFLLNNDVGICTSLDGQEFLHNKHRISKLKNGSYKNAIKWLKIINKEIRRNKRYKYRVNALTTITRDSLDYPEKIIDEFIRLGLEGIHLRPVNPFGLKRKLWSKISVSADEFKGFYERALNYIIDLNKKGKDFYERTAKIFLTKIIAGRDRNFLDIRSPCGAGIGQIAYNYNGDVYTCDEGRMLSVEGDDSFRLGNVKMHSYKEIVNSETVKAMCVASCLDNLAGCSVCVYKPYCGVCPIYNYVTEGNVFSKNTNNERCKIHTFILDLLFKKLANSDKQTRDILVKWAKEKF